MTRVGALATREPHALSGKTIRKAVIAAAGLGTRLLTATKEQPKEMLPVFASSDGELCIKPLAQLIFEQIYDFGVREFLFVVGRGKRVIEDHFTPDRGFLKVLTSAGKGSGVRQLEQFYSMIRGSRISWVNQDEPLGFGHAVLQVNGMTGDQPFLVCAGDTYILSEDNSYLSRLIDGFYKGSTAAAVLLREVADPRPYGVAETKRDAFGLSISKVVEKPRRPKTNIAILPIYVFNSEIFDALRDVKPGHANELQLTDAIQRMIESGKRVAGVKLRAKELRLDVGVPKTYWDALAASYRYFSEHR